MSTVYGSDPYLGVEGTSTGVSGNFIPPPLASTAGALEATEAAPPASA